MLELWYIFPISIVISTIAMMSGIGGAILFSPVLILILKVDPLTALATGLLIEIFGFTSGLIGHIKERNIRFDIVKKLWPFAVTSSIIGVVIGHNIPQTSLEVLLSSLLLILGVVFITTKTNISSGICNYCIPKYSKILTSFGGLLVGMVSSGLGEINEFTFLKRMHMSPRLAAGTSVCLIAITAIVGIIAHSISFVLSEDISSIQIIANIAMFAVPGVILGAQIGVFASKKVSLKKMIQLISILFILLGILTAFSTFFKNYF